MKILLLMALVTLASFAQMNPLQLAIATCDIEKISKLLKNGADPNGTDFQGKSVLRWFASNQRCTDGTALTTAQLLNDHGAKFEDLGASLGPSFLSGVAYRGYSDTLKYLVSKKGVGDPTQALRTVSRKGDVASIKVLLAAGADPLTGVALTSALFEASAAKQGASVEEMLKHVEDKKSPKVLAALEIAKRQGSRDIEKIFLSAGVTPLEEPSARPLPCQRHELSPAQVTLLKKLNIPNAHGLAGVAGSMTCKFVQNCGDMLLVDCNSAADGPAYYINKSTETITAICGGACMKGCTGCPPKGWTCECKL